MQSLRLGDEGDVRREKEEEKKGLDANLSHSFMRNPSFLLAM